MSAAPVDLAKPEVFASLDEAMPAILAGRDAVIVSRPRHTTPHAETVEAVQSGEPA